MFNRKIEIFKRLLYKNIIMLISVKVIAKQLISVNQRAAIWKPIVFTRPFLIMSLGRERPSAGIPTINLSVLSLC